MNKKHIHPEGKKEDKKRKEEERKNLEGGKRGNKKS